MKLAARALLIVLALTLIAGQQDTNPRQAGGKPLGPKKSGGPDAPPITDMVSDPNENPFDGPRRPMLASTAKNEGILDKIRRLGGYVETDPLDGAIRVSVWSANITDDDVVALAALDNLGSLDLPRFPITERAAERLARNQRLFYLNLAQSGVTDHGLKALAKLPRLRTLDLADTKITDEGIVSLKVTVKESPSAIGPHPIRRVRPGLLKFTADAPCPCVAAARGLRLRR